MKQSSALSDLPPRFNGKKGGGRQWSRFHSSPSHISYVLVHGRAYSEMYKVHTGLCVYVCGKASFAKDASYLEGPRSLIFEFHIEISLSCKSRDLYSHCKSFVKGSPFLDFL